MPATTNNTKLQSWVSEVANMTQPDSIYWCDGSQEEYNRLCQELTAAGTFKPIPKRPGSFYAQSDPADVARVEERTFICTPTEEAAGPNNNWREPSEMKALLGKLSAGSMKGRIMYVIPFSMGPIGGPMSQIGVELSDSAYVAVSMRIMTRMGQHALDALGEQGDWVKCIHTVGAPLQPGEKSAPWPCNAEKYIVHFPQDNLIWSFGSGYGGNALLGKKCFSLRIASYMAKEQGWLAEHMLILGITNPEGQKKYIAAAFPSACGKTNLAMMEPSLPGWKVETVGDDIAWLKFGDNGQLYAINPEAGFFGVAPGTSMDSNPNAMRSIMQNSIFTNTALTPDGDVWWEGMGVEAPEGLIDWRGNSYDVKNPPKDAAGKVIPAAHPNSRFTAPAAQCPVIDAAWERPEGVPISAIFFGGRRASTVPLVHAACSWGHGVFSGAIMGSEMTAAAAGTVGKLRRDPFAMLPFCGYNMGDYFQHWLDVGQRAGAKLPKIFYVNWFRKDKDGKWLWPGYSENSRVLKWALELIDGKVTGVMTPIGLVPAENELDISGIKDYDPKNFAELMRVDPKEWQDELAGIKEHFDSFGSRAPQEMYKELRSLEMRLT